MTDPTELAKLRHLYQNMVNGAVRDTASAKRIADGLLAPAIEALERATPPAEQQAAPKAAPGERLDECFPGESRVAVPQGLISAACFAIRNKRDGGKVLEQLRRYSVGDLSQPLAPQPAPAPLSDDDLVELGKSEKSGLHPWGSGTTRADYLRAVRAVLDAAHKQGDTP